MSLETITGNLRDVYNQLKPGTMLHVDELMNERRDNHNLRNQWFYTADGEIYYLDGAGNPTLAMTREAHNPVLQNIDDAFEQLTHKHNYRPNQAKVRQVLAAPDTVLITLPNLRLSGDGSEWRYLTINTAPAKYGKLNDEERKFAERVYGKGDDFDQNMEMLKKAKIGETRIYVLNPDYVRKHAEEGAVARASWLSDSLFDAGGRNFDCHSRVRGVRRGSEALRQQGHERSDSTTEAPAGRDARKTTAYREQGAILGPSFDEVLAYSASYVPEVVREQYEAGLRNIYKK